MLYGALQYVHVCVVFLQYMMYMYNNVLACCDYRCFDPPAPQASDPLVDANKQKQIASRLDEYHQRQWKNFIISPARQDPFADGKTVFTCMYMYNDMYILLAVVYCGKII